MCCLNSCAGCTCLSPEKDFSSQIVPDSIEILLIEQNFTDGPVKGAVRQVRHHVLPAKLLSDGQCDILTEQGTQVTPSALLT